ncbi:MAG: MBOAT family protein [Bacilli bacterium]|nr:MBOAT family protein [Bacilli bacterium]
MIFSSLSFLFFFLPLLLVIYYISKDNYKNYILLIFSLIFYSWGEPVYILLMILSIIINYIVAILIDKYKDKKIKKFILIIGILIDIGLLFYFKYSNFFIDILNNIFGLSYKITEIVLPIGISFYTFQEISYLVDVYLNRIKVQKNIFNLGTYISFFPQLIAGPIVRYKDIEKQLKKRSHTFEKFTEGIRRFMIGFCKKVLIANNAAIICNTIFNSYELENYKGIILIIGIISFTIQIYYDFSGYSDMAIGLAKMFGFELLENFNYPYIATSIKDFWKRWHISLSSWFKDYVYIPLGGSRVSTIKNIINILIVWLLTGFWHGANYNFIIWGLYYAILLLIEKALRKYIVKIPIILKWIFTFILINIGWLIFKIEDINILLNVFKNMFILDEGNFILFITKHFSIINQMLFVIIGLIFMFPIYRKLKEKNNNIINWILDITICLLFILSICSLISNSYNPFIYFRF